MSWEGLKNILLFSLIVISGLLTWSYWFYQPTYEIDSFPYATKITSNGNVEPDEVVQPTKLLYHDKGSYYGTYSEAKVTEMIEAIKGINLFNFQNLSENYEGAGAIRGLIERDGTIEVVFNDQVPLSFYKKYLKIEDSDVPEVSFDRIVIFTEKSDETNHSIYFVSEAENMVNAASVENGDLERVSEIFASASGYERYKKIAITDERTVVVPANEQRLSGYRYLTKYVTATSFVKALFSSPDIVKREGDIYTDGLSIMKVNSKTRTLEYKNLAVGAKEEKNPDTHILQRSIDYINIHAGWDKRYRYAAMDESDKETIYRLYIDGLPVFNDLGMSEYDVEWGTENVRLYERPYVFLGDKALTRSEAILPKAEDALASFKKGMSGQYNPDKLEDMTIGYEMTMDESTGTDIVVLTPTWYFFYDQAWVKVADQTEGGIIDGLE